MLKKLLSHSVTNISNFKKNPMAVVTGSEGVLTVLSRNNPVFYCVKSADYGEILDRLDEVSVFAALLDSEGLSFEQDSVFDFPVFFTKSSRMVWCSLSDGLRSLFTAEMIVVFNDPINRCPMLSLQGLFIIKLRPIGYRLVYTVSDHGLFVSAVTVGDRVVITQ